MTKMPIRDASRDVKVVGHGPSLVLMHAGPGWDHVSPRPFRELAAGHPVLCRDHRCVAGHDDFLFPPRSQALLAAGIPNARLRIIERAGHHPQSERPAETLRAIADFLAIEAGSATRAPAAEKAPAPLEPARA